jgi:hypothetical protein
MFTLCVTMTTLPRILLHALAVLGLAVGKIEEGRERVPFLRLAERKHRRLAAAAPRARVDALDHDALALQALAHAAGLCAAFVRKVALSHAILESIALRITEARFRRRVPHEEHGAAAAQLAPRIGSGQSQRRGKRRQREKEGAASQSLTAGLSE